MHFHDHFSGHASDYSRFRPQYPPALYAWLAEIAPAQDRVWDCATGNGQAALALAEHFAEVWATDASATQIAAAPAHPSIRFRVHPAEASGLDQGAVSLVTVAQALHWFDFEPFFAEAQRVLRPGGVLAAWCYELFAITPAVDAPMFALYQQILSEDWPPERRHVETGYAQVPWPWAELATPAFAMEADWTVEQTLGYLRTWSACRRYIAREGRDPVGQVEGAIREAWGAAKTRRVRWPLRLRASRLT